MSAVITNELLEREKKVRRYIEDNAKLFNLDPHLVRALITQESRFIADARSPTGAFGYGQFTVIAAKQVQQISTMTTAAGELKNFDKKEASDPDRGIKAICATLWWLFYKKYTAVEDKKVQLEACLTFYNAGGKAANLVVSNGGHAKALPLIKQLSPGERAQADHYAPELLEWYVAWHEKLKAEPEVNPVVENPFDGKLVEFGVRYRALVEALRLLADEDPKVDCSVVSRDGMTEITLVIPGEFYASPEK